MSGSIEIKQVAEAQNHLHRDLGSLINGCASSRLEFAAALLSRRFARLRRANQTILEHRLFRRSLPTLLAEAEEIQVPPYEGSNKHVLNMIEALEPLNDDLLGAYVHGSLGTYEEIGYSDFDALVVIRDEVFDSQHRLAGLAAKLSSLQKIMFRFDPLQHHGWFVLVEADLGFYCDAYFPRELFKYAKSLFRNQGTEICLTARDSFTESSEIFMTLCHSILSRIDRGHFPRTLYGLKSLLSEVMILPALYVHLRDGNAVYKKYSFDLASADFTTESWEIMRKISAIRAGWNYIVPRYRTTGRSLPPPLSQVCMRLLSPPIPDALAVRLNKEFYSRISQLIAQMRQALVSRTESRPPASV